MKKSVFTVNFNSVLAAFVCCLFLFLSYFVGFRRHDLGTDTLAYVSLYNSLMLGYDVRISEFIFVNLMLFFSYFTSDPGFAFMFISFMSSFLLIIIALSISESSITRSALIVTTAFFIILSPFYWNTQINIIRSGVSLPFIYLTYLFYYKRKTFFSLISLLLALGFHWLSIIFIFPVFLIKRSVRTLIAIFIFLSIIYLSGLSVSLKDLFLEMFDLGYYKHYFSDGGGYKSGIRYDFYLFSVFFLSLLVFFRNANFEFLLKLYVILLYPFLIFGFLNYSDRLLVASWNLIPLIFSCFLVNYFRAKHVLVLFLILLLIIFPYAVYNLL